MRLLIAVLGLLAVAWPARGQIEPVGNEPWINKHLAGHIVKFENKHGNDSRIFSPILGMPRDLSVYVPPGYNPGCAYPLVLFFHMADIDERYFVCSKLIRELDDLIVCGAFPPTIVACPDGSFAGCHPLNAKHSLYVNGLGGQFKDHILEEVIPFLSANYTIRPEREAHALIGFSAGGYGAMGIAIERRDYFGSVVTLAAPLNLRYSNCDGVYFEDFNPLTYRWKTSYDPDEVIGIFYCGLRKVRAGKFLVPVFGETEAAVPAIIQTNPADLLFITDLRPGQLAIYVGYPGQDNFNFDAQAESFAWLAAQKGIGITLVRDPEATHGLSYFRENMRTAFLWLGAQLPGPASPFNPRSEPLQTILRP
jgi:S-formylglutathione hydrolase FrmB